jgi:citrate lyase subunit beta/citryl-CoA lyase
MNSQYLLRSVFFVPSHITKYLDKIPQINADAYILDLEDSVPQHLRENARLNARHFFDTTTLLDYQFIVRINPLEDNTVLEDLDAVISNKLFAIMPAKIRDQNDISFLDNLLTQYEAKYKLKQKIKLLPLIETLDSFLNVREIVKSSERLIGLAFGGEDYLNDLQGSHGVDDHTFDYPRTKIAIAAKSANLVALDTPFLDVKNHQGFIKREEKSKDLGYDGCLLIHPVQVELANESFSPPKEDIENAKNIKRAVLESKDNGLSVVLLDGKLIGPPMQKKAEKILNKVELIKKKSKWRKTQK